MRLLHVIHTLDPRTGGVVACLRAFVPELQRRGHAQEIAALDPAGTEWEVPGAAAIHRLGPARPPLARAPLLSPWLAENRGRFAAVLVHGLWHHKTAAVRAVLRGTGTPYLVFPHGMLDPWFNRAYPLKHLGKALYWRLREGPAVRDAAGIVFTCEEERRLGRTSFSPYSAREFVSPLGLPPPPPPDPAQPAAFFARCPEAAGRAFILFLGRIHEKKGPDLLIEAFARLREAHPSLDNRALSLVIAGPGADPASLASLKAAAAARCPAGSVLWPGMLEGDAKWGAFRSAAAFILPSHQENFGLAVAESLACGTPVLISDQVNIWREIDADGAGLVEPDTAAGAQRLLGRWLGLGDESRRAMAAAAAACFNGRFEISRAGGSLLDVLSAAVRND